MDRLLDEARSGPMYLRRPAIADMIVEAIEYNASVLRHYILHSFVVMPNHVHLLASPLVAPPKRTKSLKGITAKRANEMLALTGSPFWQEESYDRLVRSQQEFDRIQNYIERNPVRAGLVREASEYRWSSAGWPTEGSAPHLAYSPTPAPSATGTPGRGRCAANSRTNRFRCCGRRSSQCARHKRPPAPRSACARWA